MSEPGPEDDCTIRRHATRPHRLRGRHRASWSAELTPLLDGTQRRYSAVVGAAVVGASAVAITTAAALPSSHTDPAASQAISEIAELGHSTTAERSDSAPQSGPAGDATAEPGGDVADAGMAGTGTEEDHRSPVTAQAAQITWKPMLDDINITSLFGPRWGRNHNGVDFSAATGTPVYAAYEGTVTHAGWANGFGNLVIIDHGDGIETYYAHNSAILVEKGEWIGPGGQIAEAGNTGFSFGSHVHFEVHENGKPVEPLTYLEEVGLELD